MTLVRRQRLVIAALACSNGFEPGLRSSPRDHARRPRAPSSRPFVKSRCVEFILVSRERSAPPVGECGTGLKRRRWQAFGGCARCRASPIRSAPCQRHATGPAGSLSPARLGRTPTRPPAGATGGACGDRPSAACPAWRAVCLREAPARQRPMPCHSSAPHRYVHVPGCLAVCALLFDTG
jgi:hypothetical protein